VDERARDGERTVSGVAWEAAPTPHAPEPSLRAEANGRRTDDNAAPPRVDEPGRPLLPRAASGGAGAVAALTTEVSWGAAKQPDGVAGEPDALPFQAQTPPQIATAPLHGKTTPAVEVVPQPVTEAEPARGATDGAASEAPAADIEPGGADGAAIPEPPAPEPMPAQALDSAARWAADVGLERAKGESITQESDGWHAPPSRVQALTPEVPPTPADDATSPADARDAAPFPQIGGALEDRSAARTGVAGLIPQVQPTPPALSPSVTPALGPVRVEPEPIKVPDAIGPSEASASASEAVPTALWPANAPLHPLSTPARPQLMDTAIAASARTIPVPAPTPARELPPPSRRGFGLERGHWRLLLGAGLGLLIGAGGLLLVLILLYRWVDPPASTLMLSQRLAGMPTTQRWIPLERMSPNLVAAVIASEDGHFCRHHGVDWGELREAIESAGDGLARGGSTISMQVVKNLFLWPSRSYVRKAIEIALAYSVEALWSKRRILEIYLNIAEWGPGIFGAEAAARYHFRKPALLLTAREAALLAVSLPNPFERQAGRPGPGTLRLADHLLLRMKAAQANTSCVRAPRYGG
jgi:monofunctional biosynthetic peptidoglycan transglycosylase